MSRTARLWGLSIVILTAGIVLCSAASSRADAVPLPADSSDGADDLMAQAPAGKTAPAPAPKPTTPAPAPTTPAPTTPAPTPPQEDFLSDVYGRAGEGELGRLAGTPNMFGDGPEPMGNGVRISGPGASSMASTPLAGGNRRIKIAENDNTLPQDRVFFTYNHFQDAASVENFTARSTLQQSISLDRYMIGFEKTFCDGQWACELRMPFGCGYGFGSPDFSSAAGQIGNLSVVVKRMFYKSDTTAAAVGLCIDTPTGSNATGVGQGIEYTIRNQAVFLMPYLAILRTPNDKLFYQAFLQLDVPTNGDRIDYVDPGTGTGTFGTLTDQTLVYADLSVGYWLSRNPDAPWVTGLAGVLELHYTGTVNDAQIIDQTVSSVNFQFGNFANRVNVLDLTAGLHAELVHNTICRVAGVLPLRTGDDRLFNAEVQVQLERRF
jgi:hypothetical protein